MFLVHSRRRNLTARCITEHTSRWRRLAPPEALEVRAAPGATVLELLVGVPLFGPLLASYWADGSVPGSDAFLASEFQSKQRLKTSPAELRGDPQALDPPLGEMRTLLYIASAEQETAESYAGNDREQVGKVADELMDTTTDIDLRGSLNNLRWLDELFTPPTNSGGDQAKAPGTLASEERAATSAVGVASAVMVASSTSIELTRDSALPEPLVRSVHNGSAVGPQDSVKVGSSAGGIAASTAEQTTGPSLAAASGGSTASDAAISAGSAMADSGSGGGSYQLDGGAPPDALDDTAEADEDSPIDIHWLTYNDVDPELDSVSVVAVTQGAHGSATLGSGGIVTYAPAENWFGTDAFTYTASDGTSTDTATVTVTVTGANDVPIASAVGTTTSEDTPVLVALSGTDVETSELTFQIDAAPTYGTLGESTANTVTYYPGANFYGVDTFTYQAYDGDRLSEPAIVTVTVNDVADGAGVTIAESGGGTHVSEPGLLEGEEAQSDTYRLVLNTAPTADVVITLQPDSSVQVAPATLTFTPANWSVAQSVTVDAVVDDVAEGDHTGIVAHSAASADPVYNNISIASVAASVTDYDFAWIGVTPPNPAVNLNEEGATGAGYAIHLTSKPTANVTVTLSPDSQATLSANSMTFTAADWDVDQAVTVTAVDDAIAEGYHQAVISLSAVSSDPTYNGLATTFSASILDNDGPNALPDEATTDEDTPLTFDPTLNDLSAAQPLHVTGVTQPSHGTTILEQDGTVTYAPAANWYGIDTLSYTVADPFDRSDSGTVTVTVNAVNDPPTVVDPGPQYFAEDDWVSLQIVASDVEETAFIYTSGDEMPGSNPLPPGLVLDAMTGQIWGWIDPRSSGYYTTDITVDDLNGGTATVTFNWTISDTNHAPLLKMGGYHYHYVGEWYQSYVNALDIDGDSMTVTGVTGLPPGVVSVGNEIYGAPTAPGTYPVTVSVSDGHGGSDSDEWIWMVFERGLEPPYAVAGFTDGMPSGLMDFTLFYPVTPQVGRVQMRYPRDPLATFTVTLTVEPAGRGTVSPSTFALRDGEEASFEVSPTAISQEYWDSYVSVHVGGSETNRAFFTNVGMRMPEHVRAFDTPDGMGDRVSMNKVNWGTYHAFVQVWPNLMDVYNVGVDVLQPGGDNSYGNAAADVTQQLAFANRAAIRVYGSMQTAPTLGADAGKLKLRASVSSRGGPGRVEIVTPNGFSVAAIPIAIKASNATVRRAFLEGPPLNVWRWGVEYRMEAVADGGLLDNAFVHERLNRVLSDGWLGDLPQYAGTWVEASAPQRDFNGVAASAAQSVIAAHNAMIIQNLADSSKMTEDQTFHFYTRRMSGEPKIADAPQVKNSGFEITLDSPWMSWAINVERVTHPWPARGVLHPTAAGSRKVEM